MTRLAMEVEKATRTLESASASAGHRASEAIVGVLRETTEGLQQSAATLDAAVLSASTRSSDAIGGLVQQLTQQMDEGSQRLAAVAGEASVRSTEAVGAHLQHLSSEIEGVNAALRGTAETATRQSTEALSGLFEKLTQDLDASATGLRTAVETGARTSVASLATTGDRLRGELAQVLEKLGQTGAALDRVVAGASGRLGEIQGDLSERTLDLQRALTALSTQVVELDRVTLATRDGGDRFVERLSGHSSALSKMADELTANQEAIDAALGRRHESLSGLIGQVGSRSGEFERVLREFTEGMERNFAAAQTRARDIGAALASASEGATSQTTSQFEAIRDNAARERERTEQALKAAYDQANSQLGEIMNSATEKFRASVAEVKDMATQVQRELGDTRAELKRGVFDLPKETSEAADAMRRVVGDQIKALKELASIVAPHGFDISEAEAAPAAPPAPPARVEGPLRLEKSATPEPGLPTATVLTIAPSPPASPEPAATDDATTLPPRPTLRPVPPAPGPGGGRQQTGWLSNLLAAASREGDEPRMTARRPSGDGLEFDHLRHRAPRRRRGGGGYLGALAPGRDQRGLAPALHRGGPAGVRGHQPPVPLRAVLPRVGRPLPRGVRAPARQDRPERPRRRAVPRGNAVGFRQGLHDAGARGRASRLRLVPLTCERRETAPVWP